MKDLRRLIRLPEVVDRTGLCRSTIYNRIEKGTFPKQKNLGGRAVAWQESDIESWLDEHGCTEHPAAKAQQKQTVVSPFKEKSINLVASDDEVEFTMSSVGILTIKSFNTRLTLSKKDARALRVFLRG